MLTGDYGSTTDPLRLDALWRCCRSSARPRPTTPSSPDCQGNPPPVPARGSMWVACGLPSPSPSRGFHDHYQTHRRTSRRHRPVATSRRRRPHGTRASPRVSNKPHARYPNPRASNWTRATILPPGPSMWSKSSRPPTALPGRCGRAATNWNCCSTARARGEAMATQTARARAADTSGPRSQMTPKDADVSPCGAATCTEVKRLVPTPAIRVDLVGLKVAHNQGWKESRDEEP